MKRSKVGIKARKRSALRSIPVKRKNKPMLLVANWKMALLTLEAAALARSLAVRRPSTASVQIVICPSFTALQAVDRELKNSGIILGAQDVFWKDQGAYTGEVSAQELRSLGCRYVILGHSERRREYNETDHMVNLKVLSSLAHGLSPILCVGESSDERRANIHHSRVSRQVHDGLRNVPPPRLGQELVVAYEPLWAIGTGYATQPHEAITMSQVIHQALIDVYGEEITHATTRVLYGGSVVPHNVTSFIDRGNIHGVLLGKASQQVASFKAILKNMSKV